MLKPAHLLLIIALTGCIGQREPGEATTTSTTHGYGLDELKIIAQDVIMGNSTYERRGCEKIRLIDEKTMECEGCHILTYAYECRIGEDNRTLHTYEAKLEFIQSQIAEIVENYVGRWCVLDSDCIPTKPLDDMRYNCVNQVCNSSPFDDPASLYCKEQGYTISSQVGANGNTLAYCVFPNGNVCPVWDLISGRCSQESDNLTYCEYIDSSRICTMEYNPVCAKTFNEAGNLNVTEYKTYRNPCVACKSSTNKLTVLGYVLGQCTTPTTTTLRYNDLVDNPQRQYCERQGFTYAIRKYATGKEYGVCIFTLDDECEANDYFQGICRPKNEYLNSKAL